MRLQCYDCTGAFRTGKYFSVSHFLTGMSYSFKNTYANVTTPTNKSKPTGHACANVL